MVAQARRLLGRLVGSGGRGLLAGGLLGALVAASASAGTLQGTVTNTLTTTGVSGVLVTIDPGGFTATTSMGGTYSLMLAGGDYTASFTDSRFQTHSEPVTVPAMGAQMLDVALTPVSPVIVTIDVTGTAIPGAALSATANIEILDGSTFSGVAWQQTAGVTATIDSPLAATTGVTLASESSYKDELIQVLQDPPIAPEDLPPNVTIPPEGFSGGLQDRFQVTAVNPFALEEAGKLTLVVGVATTSGVYTATADVGVTLPWKTAGGLRNVPLGRPVLLHAKSPPQGGSSVYDWALARPAASMASLVDATTQDPWFVPDAAGKYTLTVTDPVSGDPVTIEVYSGAWHGAITGIGSDGEPLADDCTYCHNDMIAPDKFTTWRTTGHASIFSDELNTDAHARTSCFGCHTVGYDTDVSNGGFDDAFGYASFLASGLLGNPAPDNWSNMVLDYPDTARLANVQCESCHGPHEGSHGRGAPSISLSSDNCGQCHGEPARHGRYQQWQLSGHANYQLAIDRAGSADCSRCHTANGFLTWLPILLAGDPVAATQPLPTPLAWTPDEAQPQTCPTCHNPHDTGTTSGLPTDAKVRISGDTPPLIAGFTATNVGKGAMCMTCHNSRRGLKNDATFDPSSGESSRAPHPGVQADMIMGQNAYFVTVGVRGPHSYIADTCVTCHMEKTPPPDLLSYNLQGTNHTFEPSPTICADCHDDGRVAADYQGPVATQLAALQGDLESALLSAMNVLWSQGRTIQVDTATLTGPGDLTNLIFGESSGRQAITVELTGGGTVGPIAVNSVRVLNGTTDLGDLYQFVSPSIPKAGWNFLLVTDDQSLGVHNYPFVTNILSASHAALVPEPGSLASLGVACASLAALRRRRARARRPSM
jgi:hypothetical protein